MTAKAAQSTDVFQRLGHELRTPLNALIGYADAMRQEAFGPLPAPYPSHAAIIHAAGLHLLALIEATTAATAGELAEAAGMVTEICALLAPRAAAAGLTLTTSIEPADEERAIDRLRFTQMLINLLDNALKYTPAGGMVAVALSHDADGPTLMVENRGDGAPPAVGGQGIGLEVVREICEAMRWRPRLEPAPGGRRVVVALSATRET